MNALYIMCLVLNTGIYLVLLGHNFKKHKKYLDKIREDSVRLVRIIDLNEQYSMLQGLHDIQELQPNVSQGDTAMMNLINEYIEKTARQLRYLEKKELSAKEVKQITHSTNDK